MVTENGIAQLLTVLGHWYTSIPEWVPYHPGETFSHVSWLPDGRLIKYVLCKSVLHWPVFKAEQSSLGSWSVSCCYAARPSNQAPKCAVDKPVGVLFLQVRLLPCVDGVIVLDLVVRLAANLVLALPSGCTACFLFLKGWWSYPHLFAQPSVTSCTNIQLYLKIEMKLFCLPCEAKCSLLNLCIVCFLHSLYTCIIFLQEIGSLFFLSSHLRWDQSILCLFMLSYMCYLPFILVFSVTGCGLCFWGSSANLPYSIKFSLVVHHSMACTKCELLHNQRAPIKLCYDLWKTKYSVISV